MPCMQKLRAVAAAFSPAASVAKTGNRPGWLPKGTSSWLPSPDQEAEDAYFG